MLDLPLRLATKSAEAAAPAVARGEVTRGEVTRGAATRGEVTHGGHLRRVRTAERLDHVASARGTRRLWHVRDLGESSAIQIAEAPVHERLERPRGASSPVRLFARAQSAGDVAGAA